MRRWALLGPSKSLNENLAPLRRYLDTQVNRPWDKVWSDISANLSAASTGQQHVRDHIADFVAITTFMRDGAVWAHGRYRRIEPLASSHYRLYVDPRTGLLRRNKHYQNWRQKARAEQAEAARDRAARMREIAPDMQLHLLDDGAWWEVKLAPLPRRPERRTDPRNGIARDNAVVDGLAYVDIVLRPGLSQLPPTELYGRYGVYAAAKRQLSRREVAALGLPRRRVSFSPG